MFSVNNLIKKFNLEILQLNAVNAFVHVFLDEIVFMRMPFEYEEQKKVLWLNKTFYGFRRSFFLWQRKFTDVLRRLGFIEIFQKPCIVVRREIIFFFFIDDCVIVFLESKRDEIIIITNKLIKNSSSTSSMSSNGFWKCISSGIIQSNVCDYFRKSTSKKLAKIWWDHQLIIRFLYSWIQLNCCLQKMTRRFQTSQKFCINEKSGSFSSRSYSWGLILRSPFQDCPDSMFVLAESIMQQRNEFCSIFITQKTFASVMKITRSSIKNNV